MKCYFIGLLFSLSLLGCAMQPVKMDVNEKSGKKNLTIMIYMAADNDLETYALQNLKQMERADYRGINVLVLMDRAEGYDETDGNWTDTRLFEVCHDNSGGKNIISRRLDCPVLGLSKDIDTELDMANPSVLDGFIDFCISDYKADNYALIIWGHGSGYKAVAIDDKTASYMSISSLGNAVRGSGFSVIGFDACFGGVFENLYELKDCADFTVACPGVTPAGGWNYGNLLENISSGNVSARSIAEAMAESAAVQTTIFENQKSDYLMGAFENFSKLLAETILTENDRRNIFEELFLSKSYSYSQYPCDMYLDISELADLYIASADQSLAEASVNLKNAVSEAGIGIHFIPLTSARTASAVHSSDYIKNPALTNQCRFIKENQWWSPTINGNSGSLLDKLFYTVY